MGKGKRILSKEDFYDLNKAKEIYRKFGPEALERYKQQFLDEPDESNIPVLQIFNTCKILIDTIPLAIYDEKKTEDIAEFDGDDPLDCLRYFCKAAKRYLNNELGNMEHLIKQNTIMQELQANRDMTKFYRQMEALEHGNNIISPSKIMRRSYSGFRRRR